VLSILVINYIYHNIIRSAIIF